VFDCMLVKPLPSSALFCTVHWAGRNCRE